MTVIQALEMMKTHVVTVRLDSTLADAVDRMDLYQVDELPVVDGDARLCGMLLESDVALAVAKLVLTATGSKSASGVDGAADVAEHRVKSIMQTNILSVRDTEEVTLSLIVEILEDCRRVPVVDAEGKIVGTLNRVDIIQALFERTITPS